MGAWLIAVLTPTVTPTIIDKEMSFARTLSSLRLTAPT
jgi:hypothetical protein